MPLAPLLLLLHVPISHLSLPVYLSLHGKLPKSFKLHYLQATLNIPANENSEADENRQTIFKNMQKVKIDKNGYIGECNVMSCTNMRREEKCMNNCCNHTIFLKVNSTNN